MEKEEVAKATLGEKGIMEAKAAEASPGEKECTDVSQTTPTADLGR